MNSESYIFTRLNKETACRSTPQSDWEAIGEEESVYAGNQVIGFKKIFLLWENSKRDNKGCWLLSEYRINPDIFPYTRDIISSKVPTIHKSQPLHREWVILFPYPSHVY